MSEDIVKIEGDKELADAIKKMSDPAKLLNDAFKITAENSLRRLSMTTNRRTGTTARNWRLISKGLSSFENMNDTKTQGDKGYLIVDLLNEGRGEIRPVNAQMLFIPLSAKGASYLTRDARIKAIKAKEIVRGEDYILADHARAVAGTHFLDKELEVASKELTDRIMEIVRREA